MTERAMQPVENGRWVVIWRGPDQRHEFEVCDSLEEAEAYFQENGGRSTYWIAQARFQSVDDGGRYDPLGDAESTGAEPPIAAHHWGEDAPPVIDDRPRGEPRWVLLNPDGTRTELPPEPPEARIDAALQP